MSNFVYITLDTTAPSNPTLLISGGATYTTQSLVDLTIDVSDVDKTGYQMKIWGDVDPTNDSAVQPTLSESSWVSFSATKQIALSSGDGSKTVNVIVRDAVNNESAQASDSISLDTTIPTVTTSSVDTSVISKNPGKNVASFTFSSDEPFTEYKVKVVASTGSVHDTGSVVPTVGGSVNTSGTGTFDTNTQGPISVQITGADLEAVSRFNGSGAEPDIIKVFVKDASGKWSA